MSRYIDKDEFLKSEDERRNKMINVGDKFIIEIDKVFEQDGEKLYRAKGFKSLVFDDNGLKKLVPLEEAANVNMEAARYAGRAGETRSKSS